MNRVQTSHQASAQRAGQSLARPWQHGAMVCGFNVMTGTCTSIASDVLRTVKGDYGSSG